MGLGLSLQWTEGLIWALVQGHGHLGTGSPEGSGRSAHPRDATTKRATRLQSGQPADPEECCVARGVRPGPSAPWKETLTQQPHVLQSVGWGRAGVDVEGGCHPVCFEAQHGGHR